MIGCQHKNVIVNAPDNVASYFFYYNDHSLSPTEVIKWLSKGYIIDSQSHEIKAGLIIAFISEIEAGRLSETEAKYFTCKESYYFFKKIAQWVNQESNSIIDKYRLVSSLFCTSRIALTQLATIEESGDRIERIFRRLLILHPNKANSITRIDSVAIEGRLNIKSRDLLIYGLTLNPSDINIWRLLANYHLMMAEDRRAEYVITRASMINPRDKGILELAQTATTNQGHTRVSLRILHEINRVSFGNSITLGYLHNDFSINSELHLLNTGNTTQFVQCVNTLHLIPDSFSFIFLYAKSSLLDICNHLNLQGRVILRDLNEWSPCGAGVRISLQSLPFALLRKNGFLQSSSKKKSYGSLQEPHRGSKSDIIVGFALFLNEGSVIQPRKVFEFALAACNNGFKVRIFNQNIMEYLQLSYFQEMSGQGIEFFDSESSLAYQAASDCDILIGLSNHLTFIAASHGSITYCLTSDETRTGLESEDFMVDTYINCTPVSYNNNASLAKTVDRIISRLPTISYALSASLSNYHRNRISDGFIFAKSRLDRFSIVISSIYLMRGLIIAMVSLVVMVFAIKGGYKSDLLDILTVGSWPTKEILVSLFMLFALVNNNFDLYEAWGRRSSCVFIFMIALADLFLDAFYYNETHSIYKKISILFGMMVVFYACFNCLRILFGQVTPPPKGGSQK